MSEKIIYMDNAATTQVLPEVLKAMLPFFNDSFGNPSSMYSLGAQARIALTNARVEIAQAIGASPQEIYFTSGGSESDNWAVFGMAQSEKKHIITTAFEHPAILNTAKRLEKLGFDVTYLPVNSSGFVSADDVAAAINGDTALVSVMAVNNEVGTIQPIAEIGKICREQGVPFHTDAVQALGSVKLDVNAQNVDMMSISAHKIHGPKGIGALYIRKGIKPERLIFGGEQESGRRAGTENVAAAVGFARAASLAVSGMDEKNLRLLKYQDRLISAFESLGGKLNGSREARVCSNVNVSFAGQNSEALLLRLDAKGICVSAGSACASGSLSPSHVLVAMGIPAELQKSALRFTMSALTAEKEVEAVCKAAADFVK